MDKPRAVSPDDVLEHAEWVTRLARAMVSDRDDARDVAQEAWIAAIADRGRRGPLGAWLTGVVRNLARNRARTRLRRARHETPLAVGQDAIDPAPTPDTIVERIEAQRLVAKLVLDLDEPVREALFLRYYEGLSSTEIARRLRVPAGTVRWRLKCGIEALRSQLDVTFGHRRSWALLLLPASRLATGPALGAALKGVVIVKKLVAVGAILVALVVGLLALRAVQPEHPAGRSDSVGSTGGVVSRQRVPGVRRDATDAVPGWFGSASASGRVIAGRVLFNGEAVAGARVVLTSEATRTGLLAPEETVTTSDGRFTFGRHRAASYDVTATTLGKGHGFAHTETNDPTAKPSPDQLTIRLSGCAHALYGRVRDASGGPIVGAEVVPARGRARGITPLGVGATTDEDGRYQLCLPPGPLTAIVRATGYGSVTIFDTIVERRQFDVELIPEAVVVGRVVRAGSGEPVAHAAVWLYPAAWPERIQTTSAGTVTGSDGRFRFTAISPGTHQLFAITPDLWQSQWATTVVGAGQSSAEVFLKAAPPEAILRGRVVEDGHAVPGARVAAHAGNRWYGGRPSDELGRFEIRIAQVSALRIDVADYTVLQPTEAIAPDRLDVEVVVRSQGSISGRVVRAGAPVADAQVTATGPARRDAAQTITEADGAFELRGLPAGRYELRATSPALQATSSRSRTTIVELDARERRDGVVLDVDAAASIAGNVVDQDGRAVAGALVQYARAAPGDSCKAMTGEQGDFRCGMLQGGGDYTAVVQPDPMSAITLRPVGADEHAHVDLADGSSQIAGQLLRVRIARSSISGRVVTTAGAPIADVKVRAIESTTGYAPATAPWVGIRTALTDKDGDFEISVLDGTTFTVHARSPSGGETALTGVAAGARGLTLRLESPGSIRGTLVGFDRRPEVFVRPVGNTVDFIWPTVDEGSFSIDGVSAGRYAVTAVAGSQGATATIDVQPGATMSVTLQPRPVAKVRGRTVDFLSARPISGVQCFVYPYEPGGGIAYWGTPIPAPTDPSGEFSMAAPAGLIEVTCHGYPFKHSEGAARLVAKAGDDNLITIDLVVSDRSDEAPNGIGAHFLFGFDEPRLGYLHTVAELRPGGAAEQAGLRVGDIIAAVDGREVHVLTDLEPLLGTHDAGQSVVLTIVRGSTRRDVRVTVEGPW